VYFNIYTNCLHKDTQILQYVNDIVLFSSNKSLSLAYNSLSTSLDAIYKSLRSLGLDLAPNKSQAILFSRDKKSPDNFEPLLVRGILIPVVNSVKFLEVTLDHKLNGVSHLKSLLDKGQSVQHCYLSFGCVVECPPFFTPRDL